MKNQFNLNIQTPCQEDFNSFSPTKAGGFCDTCQQEVVDFTAMNAQEITQHFSSNNTQNTCGRFTTSQLSTYEAIPEKRNYLSFLSGIGLACFSLLSLTTAQAQDTGTKQNTTVTQTNKEITVKGTIKDQYGEPLPFVNIVLNGTSTGTSSDENGEFLFPKKLKKGDVLVFSYVGYQSKKVIIKNSISTSNIELNVDMNNDEVVIMGKVATKEVFKSKKD
ncbi:MAG: carboxypeptidase-like regulatory domain-containing protein [Olleya sp.]